GIARRLYLADGDGVHPGYQSRTVQEHAVRSGSRFRADRAGRSDADAARGAPFGSRDRRQEPGRVDQGESGEIHLRLLRAWLNPASVRWGITADGGGGDRVVCSVSEIAAAVV